VTSSGEAAAAELRQPETPDSFAAVMRQRYDALKATLSELSFDEE